LKKDVLAVKTTESDINWELLVLWPILNEDIPN